MNDPIAGCDTDSLVKKNGKWQFRDDGRTDAKDEIGPTEEELAEFWNGLDEQQRKEWEEGYNLIGDPYDFDV